MDKITIEQVEKLQQRANVSYEEAKEALEKCDGDILEALIMLEKEGKTAQTGGGSYRTNGQTSQQYDNQNQRENNQNNNQDQGQDNQNNYNQNNQGPEMNYNGNQQQSNFGKQVDSLWKSFCRLLHKGNINHFVISKNYEEIVRMPVTVLIILLIIFNAAALVLLIILLFFGFRYSFSGPDLGKQSINNVMDSASSTAEDIKESAKEAANSAGNQGGNTGNNGTPNNNGNPDNNGN